MTEIRVVDREGLELHRDKAMAHRLPLPGAQIVIPRVGLRRVQEVHGDMRIYRVVVG